MIHGVDESKCSLEGMRASVGRLLGIESTYERDGGTFAHPKPEELRTKEQAIRALSNWMIAHADPQRLAQCDRCDGTTDIRSLGGCCPFCGDPPPEDEVEETPEGKTHDRKTNEVEEPAKEKPMTVRRTKKPTASVDSSAAEAVEVDLASVRLDSPQARCAIDDNVVSEYATRIDDLPPAELFRDAQGRHWIGDGHHRVRAAQFANRTAIRALVKPGGRREALLVAAGANAFHGLRRTAEDKRRAVRLLVEDEEWSSRSDRWIAETCRVSPTFVADVRRQLDSAPLPAVRRGRDGKVRRLPRDASPPAPKPPLDVEPDPKVITIAGTFAKSSKLRLVDKQGKHAIRLVEDLSAVEETKNGVRIRYSLGRESRRLVLRIWRERVEQE